MQILGQITGNDPEIALVSLNEMLSLDASRAPVRKLLPGLTECFRRNNAANILQPCVSCMSYLVEEHGGNLFDDDVISKATMLLSTSPLAKDLGEEIINFLDKISDTNPEIIGKNSDLLGFLQHFHEISLPHRRRAIFVLEKVTQRVSRHEHSQAVSQIGELMTYFDDQVALHAVHAFVNIGERLHPSVITQPLLMQAISTLLVTTRGDRVLLLMKFLNTCAKNSDLAQYLIAAELDFGLILDQVDARGKFMDLLAISLDTLIRLVPPPNGYEEPFSVRHLEGEAEYAMKMAPFIESLVLEHIGCEKQCLCLLAALLRLYTPANVKGIIHALAGYALVPTVKREVFLAVRNLQDKSLLSEEPSVLAILKNADPYSFNEILGPEFDRSVEPVLKTVSSIGDLDLVSKMRPWEIWTSDIFEAVTQYLRTITDEDISPELEQILARIGTSCCALLQALHLPPEADPLSRYTAKAFKESNMSLFLKHGGDVNEQSDRLTNDLAHLEYIYNDRCRKARTEAAVMALTADPALAQVLPVSEIENAKGNKKALIHRACRTPGYHRFKFIISGKEFSAYDNLFQAFSASVPEAIAMRSTQPTIELVETTEDVRHHYVFREIPLPEHVKILDVLSEVNRLQPNTDLLCKSYARRLFTHFCMPAITVGRFSFAGSLVNNYPFIFPFDMRRNFARMTAFDLRDALTTIHQKFDDIAETKPFDIDRIKCVVRRDAIWQDGCTVIERLAPGHCYLDVEFKGESGIGAGPTQEFFTLFMRACCETARNAWSEPGDSESQYVPIPENGLFPRPNADPHFFYILGLTLAKAYSMSCVCEMPLNPVFFEVMRNPDRVRKTIYKDINRDIATFLDDPDNLYSLSLVYPGIDELEMVEGGIDLEVDEDNVGQFVEFVKNTMLCRHLAEAFKKGFTQVLPWNFMTLFTDKELAKLFYGNEHKLTHEELEKAVVVSHGYTPTSPVVGNLFDVLCEMSQEELEMFWEFTTGSKFLPIDGVLGLNPPLTVVKKSEVKDADKTLPSVMTCTNYLKLPEYSSKEILRAKLIMAIQNGRGAFHFT